MSNARKLLVLVVDDNATNRMVLTKTIELLGGEVRIAENGLEALDRSNAASFDLVFMDLAMPVMDGIEATGRLRDSGMTAPIIAVTAQMTESDLPMLLEKGFDDIIPKPITVSPISDAMDYAREMSVH